MTKERIAIIDGIRTPMGKARSAFKNIKADDLGARILQEIIIRNGLEKIDHIIFGNVAQPAHAANIARVIALKSGVSNSIPAFTVNRNCASAMQAVTSGIDLILSNKSEVVISGGVESMSNIPFIFNQEAENFFYELAKRKNLKDRILMWLKFRPKFIKPIVGIKQGLTDPVSGMIMGESSELLVKEFNISRESQDKFALMSHQKASLANENGHLKKEIIPIYNCDPINSKMIEEDEGIRKNQTLKDLKKLKPYFEKETGTVTVGNSSQITDGAAAVILMKESKAKELNLKPLGYIREYCYSGLEPERMGLGPVYSTSDILKLTNLSLNDIDLIEINEAFASQVLACKEAFSSQSFAKEKLGRDKKLGDIEDDSLNVNGGAIALGHPVGMTAIRLIITSLYELKRRNKHRSLITLCIGGGQGGACILENS